MTVVKNNNSSTKITPPSKRRAGFIKYWLPVIIYAILIFCLSSISGEDIPSLFIFQDVIFHVIEYAILAILVNRALKASHPELIYIRRFFWVFTLSFIYALSDEFHQAFVPNRFYSLYDIAYDSMGILITNIFYR